MAAEMLAGDTRFRIRGDTDATILCAISRAALGDTFGACEVMMADTTAGDSAGEITGTEADGLACTVYWVALVIGV